MFPPNLPLTLFLVGRLRAHVAPALASPAAADGVCLRSFPHLGGQGGRSDEGGAQNNWEVGVVEGWKQGLSWTSAELRTGCAEQAAAAAGRQ